MQDHIPSVVKATEAPATSFSIPDVQDSNSTEYLPAVSSLTETMKVAISEEHRRISGVGFEGRSPMSGDFATADFYFEDAMPSPVKSDSETVALLQAELMDKINQIRELEEKLKKKSNPDVSVSSLEDATRLPKETSFTESKAVEVSCEQLSQVNRNCDCCDSLKSENAELKEKLNVTNDLIADLQDSSKTYEDKLAANSLSYQTCVKERIEQVSILEERLKDSQSDFENQKRELNERIDKINTLEQFLNVSNSKNSELQKESVEAKERLMRIRTELINFRDKTKNHLPSFRSVVEDLRTTMTRTKQEMEDSVSTTVKTVEDKVNSFNKSNLNHLSSAFDKEKDVLTCEIARLERQLSEAQSEHKVKVSHLTQNSEELSSRLVDCQSRFTKQYEEQQAAFDSTVKELETKHTLETELEVDRCRTEMRKLIDEAEQKLLAQVKLNEETIEAFNQFKTKSSDEKQSSDSSHQETLVTLEKNVKQLETSNTEINMQLKSKTERIEELEVNILDTFLLFIRNYLINMFYPLFYISLLGRRWYLI